MINLNVCLKSARLKKPYNKSKNNHEDNNMNIYSKLTTTGFFFKQYQQWENKCTEVMP